MHRASRLLVAAGLIAAPAALGACGGSDDDAAPAGPAVVAADGVVRLEAFDMGYRPEVVEVPAGEVTIAMSNTGRNVHDVRITGFPFLIEAGPGDAAEGTVTLGPGDYELFCSLPGHKDAGMVARLQVR